jgi:CRISPR/Cas system CSM-associated protein Csm2 small subunit
MQKNKKETQEKIVDKGSMVKKDRKGHKHQDNWVKKLQKYFKGVTVSNQNALKIIVNALPKVKILILRKALQLKLQVYGVWK